VPKDIECTRSPTLILHMRNTTKESFFEKGFRYSQFFSYAKWDFKKHVLKVYNIFLFKKVCLKNSYSLIF